LLKRQELAFFGAKNEVVLNANELKTNPKTGPKNRLLRGIEAKFAGRKAPAGRRVEGGYMNCESDVGWH
jgi:hypothetical protein